MNSNKQIYWIVSGLMVVGYAWITFQVYHSPQHQDELSFCLFKSLTGMACPSCGTTRSIVQLCEGNITEAFLINPLGLVASIMLLITPFWIMVDGIRGSESIAEAYRKAEVFVQQQKVYIPLITLLILNWYWNIEKGL